MALSAIVQYSLLLLVDVVCFVRVWFVFDVVCGCLLLFVRVGVWLRSVCCRCVIGCVCLCLFTYLRVRIIAIRVWLLLFVLIVRLRSYLRTCICTWLSVFVQMCVCFHRFCSRLCLSVGVCVCLFAAGSVTCLFVFVRD